jgi:apolipoprotein D and lipocalin family protein
VVSNPSKKYLWILCRTSTMDSAIYEQILERLKQQGFDLSKIQKTKHT